MKIDFEKMISIYMQNDDFTTFIPRLEYNIIQKINKGNEEATNQNWFDYLKEQRQFQPFIHNYNNGLRL